MVAGVRAGTVARAPGLPGRLLVVVAPEDGSRALAAPYPLDAARALLAVDGASLVPEGEDPASARVLSVRRRSREAAARPRPPARPVRSAMVLCAGLGTRMRPLTLRFPKPALPFFSGPLLRASFSLLAGAGVRRVVVNAHHLPEALAEVAEREAARLSLGLSVSREEDLLGTAGGVRQARALLGDEPFLLLNGDAFMAFDLGALLGAHQASGSAATLAVMPMPEGEAFGAVEAAPDGAVRGVSPPGRSTPGLVPWHFIGAHVVEPSIFDHIPPAGAADLLRDAYPAMLARGLEVRVCPVEVGAWADLGTARRYLRAVEDLLTGLCDLGALGADAPVSEAEAARLQGLPAGARSHVDPSARVSDAASLEEAQVGPGCRVGAALLRGAAVLPGTSVEDGERLERTLACGELRLRAD